MKEIKKVYGPHINKATGRKEVNITYADGTAKTQTLARHIMQQHLGRDLESWEEVDHINEDKTDDRLENLQVLDPKKHGEKRAAFFRTEKYPEIICKVCGVKFVVLKSELEDRIRQSVYKDGLCCSYECSGRFSMSCRPAARYESFTCRICGNVFEKLSRHVRSQRKIQGDDWMPTCSSSCGAKAKNLKRSLLLTCPVCSTIFRRNIQRINKLAEGVQPCCSKTCANIEWGNRNRRRSSS